MQTCVHNHFQVPLSSICYHGSRLVQALAKFKERSLLLSSLRTLTPADLLTLASDPSGSHVLQALTITSSDKGRGKILKRLEVLLHYKDVIDLESIRFTHSFWQCPLLLYMLLLRFSVVQQQNNQENH